VTYPADNPERSRRRSARILFPAEPWFTLPIKLVDCGLTSQLTGAAFKRYVTLSRLGNYYSRNEFQASLDELTRLDGISPRRAHEINAILGEHRMIIVERGKRPYNYVLLVPSEWRNRSGQPYPESRVPRSYVRRTEWR
jgi:hypothetical protein